jgi:peptidoglycan L-alanyl-D-glutamate endopeptidase CwlK
LVPSFPKTKIEIANNKNNMNIEEIISSIQEELGITVDGKAGPETWEAIYKRIAPNKATPTATPALTQAVDDRSEKTIATLLAQVQPFARALVLKAASAGITIKVISGLRTYEEQNDLYGQGRSKPGKIVTNARGGYSNHNFGIAFDIGAWEGSKYMDDSPKYKVVGAMGIDLGLEWDGNWKTIQDEPQFQLRPEWAADLSEKDMLAELRSRKSSGTSFYA